MADSLEGETEPSFEDIEPMSYTCCSSLYPNSYSTKEVLDDNATEQVDHGSAADDDEVNSSSEKIHDEDAAEHTNNDNASQNDDDEDSSGTSSDETSSYSSSEDEDNDADEEEKEEEQYIEMSLDLGVLEEVSTTSDSLAITNSSTQPSQCHHAAPDSSSKRKTNDDGAEDIINFQPLNKKPKFVVTTDPNSVANKLPGFLEKLKTANAELKGRDEAEYRLDITEDAEKDAEPEETKHAAIEEL